MELDAAASLSTDQVAAFVELARQGSSRAAQRLLISEQGVRNRLLALEARLGVQLYRKSRGPRRTSPLTEQGQKFLPHATAFIERAGELCEVFTAPSGPRQVRVAASQYLILYLLIDAVRRFHARFPQIRVRLSTLTERDVEEALLHDPEIALGVAAPYEPPTEIEYTHLFSLDWGLVAPRGHRLLRRRSLTLADLSDEPLIFLERGSSGRQHVLDAFHAAGLSPRVEMETTNTEIIVRMVEAGLGVSIVPLLAGGQVTRGRNVGVRGLFGAIRPIQSGVLTRRDEELAPASRQFLEFIRACAPRSRRIKRATRKATGT